MNDVTSTKELINNRKVFHDYEILETFEAGIALQGTEIKSLRANGGSLAEAYVRVIRGEVYLIGSTIAPYKFGSVHNHEERRERKLLLHKREITTLEKSTQEKGLTVVPLAMYLKNGRVKLKIGIGRGKKLVDKRHALKEKDDVRRMQKIMKEHR